MYKNCFEISKQTIRKDTNAHELFFKNYRVFDGCGTVNFWTLQEARNYVMVKSKQMQNIFEYATELFSKRGKEWENWFVKITNAKTLQTTNHSGMWDCQRRRLVIKDLNMVANPGAPNGGYFGKHISKR